MVSCQSCITAKNKQILEYEMWYSWRKVEQFYKVTEYDYQLSYIHGQVCVVVSITVKYVYNMKWKKSQKLSEVTKLINEISKHITEKDRQTLIEVCLSFQRSESLSQVYTVNRKPIWRLPSFRFPALINPIFTMPGCVQYGYISNTEIVK